MMSRRISISCFCGILVVLTLMAGAASTDVTSESVLQALREQDAQFLRSFTITATYSSPANWRFPDQGMVVRTSIITSDGTASGIALTDPAYLMPPQYKAIGQGLYRSSDYEKGGDLLIWKKGAHYAIHAPDLSGISEASVLFTVHSDGTFKQDSPSFTQHLFRPSEEQSLYEFKRLLLATGRGYSRLITAVSQVERTQDGLLRVTATESQGQNGTSRVWNLVIDPSNYLVRSARQSLNGTVGLEITTTGTVSSASGLAIAAQGTVLYHAPELRYELTFQSFKQQADQHLLRSLRTRVSSNSKGDPVKVLDFRNDPAKPDPRLEGAEVGRSNGSGNR